MRVFKRFLLTLSYVTSLPLKQFTTQYVSGEGDEACLSTNSSDAGTESLAGLAKYLPAAGLMIGVILCLLAILLTRQGDSPPAVTGAVLVIAWLCLTGGLHFDGLMDAADGVFSHRNKDRMLEIMMDSRVGNFGAMTGMAVLILKTVALVSLTAHPKLFLASLLLVPTWGRWCELYAIGRFPYARPLGKGKIWHDSTKFPRDLFLGAMLPVLASAIAASHAGLSNVTAIIIFAVLSGLIASHWLASHIDGHTGDTYGAVVELSETGCLLLTAILLR